ncbi:MAG: hypothetical protein K1X92_04235 [Bacteroidia bacterium]|nr:hypothetical protein [Bacteroidia bacterium]
MMKNPIQNILSDDTYSTLLHLGLLNKKAIRDIEIKRSFIALRKSGISSADAIERVLAQYPYLQFDTLRKIIYSVKIEEEMNAC